MKILPLAGLVVMGLLAAAPSSFRLDEVGGIGGLAFGESTTRKAKAYDWLGQSSFSALDVSRNGSGSLLMGSLAMLNELVEETPVRARARQVLG